MEAYSKIVRCRTTTMLVCNLLFFIIYPIALLCFVIVSGDWNSVTSRCVAACCLANLAGNLMLQIMAMLPLNSIRMKGEMPE